MTASAVQLAKRALVSLLLALARQYGVALALNRDSPDKSVLDGYRKAARIRCYVGRKSNVRRIADFHYMPSNGLRAGFEIRVEYKYDVL